MKVTRIKKLALLIFAGLLFAPTSDIEGMRRGGRGGGRGGMRGGRGMGAGRVGRAGVSRGRGLRPGRAGIGRAGISQARAGRIGRAGVGRGRGLRPGRAGIGRAGISQARAGRIGRAGVSRGRGFRPGRARARKGHTRFWRKRPFRRYRGHWWPWWYGSYFALDTPWSYWYPSEYYRTYETIPEEVYDSYWNITNNTDSDIIVESNAGEFYIRSGQTQKVLRGDSNDFSIEVLTDITEDGQADVRESHDFIHDAQDIKVSLDPQGGVIATE